MARRRHYSKQKFKIKLKKNTVYSIFAFFIILTGILLGLSFTRSGNSFASMNDYLINYFGWVSIFFPLVLMLFGFFFLRLKIFLSRPNVLIGFLIFFVSMLGLTYEGSIGIYLHNLLADVITGLGAFFVYLAGIFVGLVVLFDTSVDELVTMIGSIFGVFQKILPGGALGFFKKKPKPLEEKQ